MKWLIVLCCLLVCSIAWADRGDDRYIEVMNNYEDAFMLPDMSSSALLYKNIIYFRKCDGRELQFFALKPVRVVQNGGYYGENEDSSAMFIRWLFNMLKGCGTEGIFGLPKKRAIKSSMRFRKGDIIVNDSKGYCRKILNAYIVYVVSTNMNHDEPWKECTQDELTFYRKKEAK